MTPRPPEAAWASANLYRVRFFEPRLPVHGTRLIWARVGYKWVHICVPIRNVKFRMRRADWNALPVCEPFQQTELDKVA